MQIFYLKKNNCVKDSELEADSIFDPSFAIKVKVNEATPEIEYIEIPFQRTVPTHKYCCICHSTTKFNCNSGRGSNAILHKK